MSVASVHEHYDRHLGRVYAWMAGGIEAAVERGTAELEDLGIAPAGSGLAVDLGSGFGMHAIPLARRGFEVLAIDGCAELLASLETRKGALPVRAVHDDLLAYRKHLAGRPAFVLCMGDTLTHLPDEESVERLVGEVAADLVPGGRFVVTLRDYSVPPEGERRFILVRSDAVRILTCLLEYGESRVTVHDLLHERNGAGWNLRVSAYQKLRLAPEHLVELLRESGLAVERSTGAAGMIRLVGRRS